MKKHRRHRCLVFSNLHLRWVCIMLHVWSISYRISMTSSLLYQLYRAILFYRRRRRRRRRLRRRRRRHQVNTIPYQCDINCAGHFTLDTLASKPVACWSCDAIAMLRKPINSWKLMGAYSALWLMLQHIVTCIFYFNPRELSLMSPYGVVDLCLHWFRHWHVAWNSVPMGRSFRQNDVTMSFWRTDDVVVT